MRFFGILALSLLSVSLLLGLSGCQKENLPLWQKGGKWKIVSHHTKEIKANGIVVFDITIENVGIYEFDKDGIVKLTYAYGGESQYFQGEYLYEDNQLTIFDTDENGQSYTSVASVEWDGKKMILTSEQVDGTGTTEYLRQVLKRM